MNEENIPNGGMEEEPLKFEAAEREDISSTEEMPNEEPAYEDTAAPDARVDEPYVYKPYHEVVPTIEMDIDKADTSYSKKGLKVFALVMAAIVLICGSMTAGYCFGRQREVSSRKPISVDLSAKPVDTDMLTAAQVYEKADLSIVGIYTYNDTVLSSASGVVCSEDGYIITNDHIYDGVAAAKFKVYTSDGKIYSAEYVAGDTRTDIAVIKVTDKVKLTPAEFGNPDELYIGEPLVAIGRPTGADTANNLTGGYVSALGRRSSATSSYTMKFIQTDTAINPGSSGGALLNMYGQVVGITSYKLASTEYEGMGFAVPMDIAKSVADSLIKNGYVAGRAKLGISYTEIDALTAEVSDMTTGLYIATVDKTSDLYGKVVEGDIIIEVNGEKITDANVMLDIIDSSNPGDTLTLVILDSKGKTRTVTAELLADKGSSSYSKTASGKENKENYTEEFDFPFGE